MESYVIINPDSEVDLQVFYHQKFKTIVCSKFQKVALVDSVNAQSRIEKSILGFTKDKPNRKFFRHFSCWQ